MSYKYEFRIGDEILAADGEKIARARILNKGTRRNETSEDVPFYTVFWIELRKIADVDALILETFYRKVPQ